MIFRNAHLARIAWLAVFALGAGACAASSEEPPLEDGAEQSEAEHVEEREETVAPKVESNTTSPQDGIGEKGSSCPIWQCGFNGLEPDALKLLRPANAAQAE
jgi:hypothetical protein